eukprot:CAMPEP_0114558936 /NCGR_PEP_ID=MMETSP0114-20121206/10656_1 /TAXON_ID=31324 /ORGANISM="Goniomonas sp, Strain m" /LENGTH=215 /DNA_ID=CAMNT_0001744377 /DNA_START=84 /DNA_END=728 /DNA_ORIENTATION=+
MGAAINKLAFYPPKDTYSHSDVSHWVTTVSGDKIPILHIRHRQPRFCLLFSHGNAEDLGLNKPFCEWLSAELMVDVVTYDYVGYGLAAGEPSERCLYECIDAVYHYLRHDLRLPVDHIVLYGKSLGSGPTVDLSSREAVRGIIIVSGLASGSRVLFPNQRNRLMDKAFCDNIGKITKVTCPVFIIHGLDDEVIHPSNSESLYQACKHVHPVPPVW